MLFADNNDSVKEETGSKIKVSNNSKNGKKKD
jgi:hypothetical protein